MESNTQKPLSEATGKIILIIILFWSHLGFSQNANHAFYVQFNDKDTNFNINEILSPKAIERRNKYQIQLNYSDYPVKKNYLQKLNQLDSITVRYALKWSNSAIIESSKTYVSTLDSLAFISEIKYVGTINPNNKREAVDFYKPTVKLKSSTMETSSLNELDYGKSYQQNQQIGVLHLHKKGFNGNRISVAVFDAGFKNITKIPGFLRHQANDKLMFGYDLVNLDNSLSDFDTHGTACASALGAYDKGKFIGSGPLAKLTLFKTENGKSEYPIEELNWCKAAEIADSLGVDIITSSLGYNQFDDQSLNYTHSQLDGNTSYISIGAKTAVSKGIIVLNSAGNQGNSKWQKIGFPADVEEVLTVGAINKNGSPARFSSRGNNANQSIKPDVVALGVRATVASPSGFYYQGNGTSFSTPIVAGGVACLLQAFPQLSPKEINDLIRQTADNNTTPDSVIGYGVARFDIAFEYQNYLDKKTVRPHVFYSDPKEVVIFSGAAESMDLLYYVNRKFLGFWKYRKKVSSKKGITPSTVHYIKNSLNIKVKFYDKEGSSLKVK
jgi:subtilisin family serine protease